MYGTYSLLLDLGRVIIKNKDKIISVLDKGLSLGYKTKKGFGTHWFRNANKKWNKRYHESDVVLRKYKNFIERNYLKI